MAAGDIIMSMVTDDAPAFACGVCACPSEDTIWQLTASEIVICTCLFNGGYTSDVLWDQAVSFDGVISFAFLTTLPTGRAWISTPQLSVNAESCAGSGLGLWSIAWILICDNGTLSLYLTTQGGTSPTSSGRISTFFYALDIALETTETNLCDTCDEDGDNLGALFGNKVAFKSASGGTITLEILPPP